MGEGLILQGNDDSNKQLSHKVGEVVVTDNSGTNSAENKSQAKSRSSYKRKVNHDKRAALVHNHMASSNSYVLQEELAMSSFKRSNSSKNIKTKQDK